MQTIKSFRPKLDIIGINPFVPVPKTILNAIFKQAGKTSSPIQVKGTVNGLPYKQNLVKHLNVWRLYINTTMLKKSPERIGERLEITIEFDPEKRTIDPPPAFQKALKTNKQAQKVFNELTPSTQKEIIRYLANLKSQESLNKNIIKAIQFLLGNGRFVGRELS